ncbi:cytochrome P450 [Circinella umbellata]|nr:cytochrome P450 [Circinella umbellata]
MSQQLTSTNFYSSKFVERAISWIRTTGLVSDANVGPTTAAASVGAIALLTTVIWKFSLSTNSNGEMVPYAGIPTPKGNAPYIGHLFTIGSDLIKRSHEWHQELGPIFYMKVGVRPFLIISDPNIAHELLVSNGRFTSSRPNDNIVEDFFGHDARGLIASPPDKKWKTLRKIVIMALGPKRLREAAPELNHEAKEFVDIVATGENINPLIHLMRASVNFIFLTTFSFRTTSIEDPIFKEGYSIVNSIMSFTGFKHSIPNLLPLLSFTRHFTNASQEIGNQLINHVAPYFSKLIDEALKADGENMAKLLNNEINGGRDGEYTQLYTVMIDLLMAGSDTSAVTLDWAFLILSTKPDIQKKIQQEIDAFVEKNGRLPEMWERDSVPYLTAVQKECMRIRPTTPFGVPHESTEAFVWRGTLIPKGTNLLSNMNEMHHNPDVYPDPDEFKPDRFLDKNESMTASINRNADERDHFNFGWGRRVCPGAHLAETQMFNVWVHTLHRCNIVPALDENGNEVPETLETVPPVNGPIVTPPSPFEIRFVLRSK